MISALVRCVAVALAVSALSADAQRRIFTRRTGSMSSMARSMASQNVMKGIARGLPVSPDPRSSGSTVTPQARSRIMAETNRFRSARNRAVQNVANKDRRMGAAQTKTTAFGPFMQVNERALSIAEQGAIFTHMAKNKPSKAEMAIVESVTCPFEENIDCVRNSKYRTIDGSCNNLQNPYWGRANTPFERFVPPQYGDGVDAPRNTSLFNTPLPLPRVVSTQVHKRSTATNIHPEITHMAMEFGQFVSHDINANTLSTGENGSALVCCTPDGRFDDDVDKKMLGCFPLELPTNDPFFSTYNRTCMNFVRAAPTPDLNCDRSYREQLNQVSQFIDASTIYGSDDDTMRELRTMSNGLLKVTRSRNGDLLLQNPAATGTPACNTMGVQHCFKTGEARANQQPALMTLHTLFMNEHNRVAERLLELNPTMEDEELYQEARKIVGAELQHITYNEYLPTILGRSFAEEFGFTPQSQGSYFGGYDPTYKPGVRNGFAAAAYRFGHGNVRDHVASGHLFKDHFLNPSIMYERFKGPSFIVRSLVADNQQGSENLMSTQLTNHLFEKAPGTGLDLAAININRGRDHGIPSYNIWRDWCGLPIAESFTAGQDGLEHHTARAAALLQEVYDHPDDIDLWTGIITETPLEGRAVGPTGACLIGRQFWILKHSDRFYYETNDATTKFEIDQLDEIRKTSLARIICDNTDMTTISADAFNITSQSNPAVPCSSLPSVDLSEWQACNGVGWSAWGPFTRCYWGFRRRNRTCNMKCAHLCRGRSFQRVACPSPIKFPRQGGYSRGSRFSRHG